jgi:hypothetical protein
LAKEEKVEFEGGGRRGAPEQHVAPLRHRYERLRAEPAALHERLIEGEQHTARRADQVLTRAMTAMGL